MVITSCRTCHLACASCACLGWWDISCGQFDCDHLSFTSTRGFPASALLQITNVVREARWCLLTRLCCCICADKGGGLSMLNPFKMMPTQSQSSPVEQKWSLFLHKPMWGTRWPLTVLATTPHFYTCWVSNICRRSHSEKVDWKWSGLFCILILRISV